MDKKKSKQPNHAAVSNEALEKVGGFGKLVSLSLHRFLIMRRQVPMAEHYSLHHGVLFAWSSIVKHEFPSGVPRNNLQNQFKRI